MLRLLLTALIAFSGVALANDDHALIATESDQAFNAKAHQCHAALGF